MQRSTRILGSIIIVLIVVGFAEFMAYVKTCQLAKYDIGFVPLDITETYDWYMARHDPRLGWVTPPTGSTPKDPAPFLPFPTQAHQNLCFLVR